MSEIAKLVGRLPRGIGLEWTGISIQEQEQGAQAPALYTLSILVVFLCLRDFWRLDHSALGDAGDPPGGGRSLAGGQAAGVLQRYLLPGRHAHDHRPVGKNAILIVQFAHEAGARGVTPRDAAMQAARLRLRPILMTSLAFIAGVLPLAVSTGPGAGSQNDIGTGVIGGMVSATILAVFFVPFFYVAVRRGYRRSLNP